MDPSQFKPKKLKSNLQEEASPLDDLLLEPSYRKQYEAWKNTPSPATSGALLRSVDPVIKSALTTYGGTSSKSPTLYSKARLMALQSLPSYDPKRAKLQTFLMSQLQGLRRAASKEERVLSVPEQVLLDRQHIFDTSKFLEEELGREPSTMELADRLKLSPKRIEYIQKYRPAMAEGSFVAQTEEGGAEPWAPAVESDGSASWREFVYHSLDNTDKLIMEYTLGMHGRSPLSNQELAKKLRVSPGAISQRKAKIQDKIDSRYDVGVM